MRILIFGGLTAVGASITNSFLQEGIETFVVKSAPFNEAEEAQELFFGRNELYRSLESGSDLQEKDEVDTVCFAGHFDSAEGEPKTGLISQFETVLERGDSIKTVILLSLATTEEVGEGRHALLDDWTWLRETEQDLSAHFERRQNEFKSRLFILRLPNLLAEEKACLTQNLSRLIKNTDENAKAVFELSQLKEPMEGVHIFELVSNPSHGNEDGRRFLIEEIL